eukprot:3505308-Rhodomonas_salina.1
MAITTFPRQWQARRCTSCNWRDPPRCPLSIHPEKRIWFPAMQTDRAFCGSLKSRGAWVQDRQYLYPTVYRGGYGSNLCPCKQCTSAFVWSTWQGESWL